jgi:hypothetical protein
MKLLLDFLCQFGWGMAAGLVLTPGSLVPGGFFRVNLLVVLGLATGVAWLGERRRAGGWLCGITAALLAAATAVASGVAGDPVGGSEAAAMSGLPWGAAAAAALLAGLVSGLTVHAMLLGHWYLNAPGMRVEALRRMIDIALAAWALQLVWSLAGLATAGWPTAGGATAAALLSLRWLAGLVGLPILLVMARKTLDIPNTQSATGILYVACLAAILGELTAQLLRASA